MNIQKETRKGRGVSRPFRAGHASCSRMSWSKTPIKSPSVRRGTSLARTAARSSGESVLSRERIW